MAEPVENTVAGTAQRPSVTAVILASLVFFSCTSYILSGGGPAAGIYELRWVLVVSDLFVGLVALTQIGALASMWSDRSRHRCALAAVALSVALLPALAAHPSARGGAAVLRWTGVALIALAVGRLNATDRTLVLVALAGATGIHVGVAVAQWAAGSPIGLELIGEAKAVEIGGRYASSGLTVHPYVLAAWCVLAGAVLLAAALRCGSRPESLSVAAAVPFVGVGLSMSRAGALAVVLVLATFGIVALRRPQLRAVVAGAAAAAALGALLNLPGWINRTAATASSGSVAAVTSNRTQLLDQAWALLRTSPVVGVGPGRYVAELVSRPEVVELAIQKPSRPVHVMPYLVLVEGGLIALPALLLLAWAVASQMGRGGPAALGVGLAVVPFLLLDHLHWSYPQGLVLMGLWLGVLDHLGRRETAAAGAPPGMAEGGVRAGPDATAEGRTPGPGSGARSGSAAG